MTVELQPITGTPQWTTGTDPFTRAQMNGAFAALEALFGSLFAVTGDLPVATAAGTPGKLTAGAASQVLRVGGSGIPGYADLVLWVGHTWTLAQPGVPSGPTNFVMPKRIRVPVGMEAKLHRVDAGIRSGSSVTFDVRRATTIAGIGSGTILTGFGSISAVQASNTVAPTPVLLADGDYLGPVPSGVVGSPDNASIDLLIGYRFTG